MIEYKSNNISMLLFDTLVSDNNIFHFVTTRHGGVSQGNYEQLNLGLYSGDALDSVMENRRRVAEAINITLDRLIIAHQKSEDKIYVVDYHLLQRSESEQKSLLEGVDALITNVKNVCIGVLTADCVPVILYCPATKVVAVSHAGWRGTVKHIVYKTVARMVKEFNCDPTVIKACIGPSISAQFYEVGDELYTEFIKAEYDTGEIFHKSAQSSKYHLDLWKANQADLLKAGLKPENIQIAGLCSYNNDDFFSARKQGVQCGRNLAGIYLK